ncbi:hypothetical protein [Parerythrobacter lacustris]|uniref:Uncharacterized protein n=1 Tax=Parerythrobacter lacustris TaxID=2969984 RepID=A0ABT1XUC7_9SPHN|nr:hypothetical protein [Parerythrobacter lacustris]MCR2835301.1 hypothetical protein [Parerythrobacter lacustris]
MRGKTNVKLAGVAGLAIPLAAMVAGCASIDTGVVDYRRAEPPTNVAQVMANYPTRDCVPEERANNRPQACDPLLGARLFRKNVSRQPGFQRNDVYSIRLDHGFIDFTAEFGFTPGNLSGGRSPFRSNAEIVILARAFEFGAKEAKAAEGTEQSQSSNEAAFLDLDSASLNSARVIYYSPDVENEQSLNFSNIPIVAPTSYNGRPIGIQIIVLELDQISTQMTGLLSSLASLGQTAGSLPTGPAADILTELGKSLLESNQDDIIFEYRFVLDQSSAGNEWRYPSFEDGRYVLRRMHHRDKDMVWRNLILDHNTGQLFYYTDPTTETHPELDSAIDAIGEAAKWQEIAERSAARLVDTAVAVQRQPDNEALRKAHLRAAEDAKRDVEAASKASTTAKGVLAAIASDSSTPKFTVALAAVTSVVSDAERSATLAKTNTADAETRARELANANSGEGPTKATAANNASSAAHSSQTATSAMWASASARSSALQLALQQDNIRDGRYRPYRQDTYFTINIIKHSGTEAEAVYAFRTFENLKSATAADANRLDTTISTIQANVASRTKDARGDAAVRDLTALWESITGLAQRVGSTKPDAAGLDQSFCRPIPGLQNQHFQSSNKLAQELNSFKQKWDETVNLDPSEVRFGANDRLRVAGNVGGFFAALYSEANIKKTSDTSFVVVTKDDFTSAATFNTFVQQEIEDRTVDYANLFVPKDCASAIAAGIAEPL